MKKFLVVYDYGTGGLWAVLYAPSEAKILKEYPFLEIMPTRPDWMGDAQFDQIEKQSSFTLGEVPPDHWLNQSDPCQ